MDEIRATIEACHEYWLKFPQMQSAYPGFKCNCGEYDSYVPAETDGKKQWWICPACLLRVSMMRWETKVEEPPCQS